MGQCKMDLLFCPVLRSQKEWTLLILCFMLHGCWKSCLNKEEAKYLGAFLRTSNSCSVGNGRPKTSFGLLFLSATDWLFSSPLSGLQNDEEAVREIGKGGNLLTTCTS
jgi:hypothetical protein